MILNTMFTKHGNRQILLTFNVALQMTRIDCLCGNCIKLTGIKYGQNCEQRLSPGEENTFLCIVCLCSNVHPVCQINNL